MSFPTGLGCAYCTQEIILDGPSQPLNFTEGLRLACNECVKARRLKVLFRRTFDGQPVKESFPQTRTRRSSRPELY